ncbi:VOC family protein [Actinopolymorpha rutila]|uniref:Catechol-2,3-dioxygenase n=1 Tax=Actinopolymorpha rutila TaxID=446787 RepID=A0A852ZH28_9ACTN|nr:VOC family protein [Actinopolymorpha rutila]NYH91218.1 catechol-2,3-dioxygenase [Actinopolymorpha rutila]
MTARIRNVVIESPDAEGLAEFYVQLLGMQILRRPPDWMVIGHEGTTPRLAFDPVGDRWQPPRWPDPDYPQQIHLDITVPNQAAVEAWLPEAGATLLHHPEHHVWADPAGHPFCLFEVPGPAKVGSIVIDSENHQTLAAFYNALLEIPKDNDWGDWITLDDGSRPRLAFTKIDRHRRPRWPDPSYPQQMHLDISVDNPSILQTAERLGAVPLPAMGGSCPVYADPAGHPVCLCLPGQ